jgi:protoporphyrinogen oxidase
MLAIAEELGLTDQLRFNPVGVGFYVDGKMHDFNGIPDFIRFPPLSPIGRARLAWFVLQCQLRRKYEPLEDIKLESWLRRHCGSKVYERIWRPLLDSRFDGQHDDLPATYLWARTNRMRSARTGDGAGETMGHLIGGHERLIEAIASRAAEHGATIRTSAGVEGLAVNDAGAVTGVIVDGEAETYDLTIPTLQPPALRHLLPAEHLHLLDAYPKRYLGVVCLILKVKQSVLPYYSVNICDPTPITTVVETSHVVGTEHTDGLRLLYLPKYCEASAPEHREDDQAIYDRFTGMLSRLAPSFKHEDVVDWTVQRAPLVEPVHELGTKPRVAPVWPGVDGLALASASQVYPRLLNGDSIVRMAEATATEAAERLGLGSVLTPDAVAALPSV